MAGHPVGRPETKQAAWLAELDRDGAANCGVWFTESEVEHLAGDLAGLLAEGPLEGVVPDPTNSRTRSFYGVHRMRPSFAALARDDRIRSAAEAVLGEPAYLYQSKLNPKDTGGAGWNWHVDFQAWGLDDGMQNPKAVTFGVNIDAVVNRSGPFTALLGSHRYFGSWSLGDAKPVGHGLSDFGVNLKYPLPDGLITQLLNECQRKAFVGPAGNVMAFLGTTVHSSPPNSSAGRRGVIYVTYNAESNRPDPSAMTRPTVVVER